MRSPAPSATATWPQALAWSLLAALALLSCQLLVCAGTPIWLVPGLIVLLAARCTRAQLQVAWLLLTLGAALPLAAHHADARLWALEICGVALDLGLMLAVTRRLTARGSALVVALGVGCLRVVIELLWSLTPLGELQIWGVCRLDAAVLSQLMNLGGASALSFLICVVSAAVAIVVGNAERRGALRMLALAWSLLALAYALELDRIGRGSSERLRVGAVAAQHNDLRQLVLLTQQAADEGCQLVVWPQRSVALAADREELAQRLASLARECGIWLAAGAGDPAGGGDLVLVCTPHGHHDLERAYRGRHALPFAGGQPGRDLPDALATRFGGLGAILGYDAMFAAPARAASVGGATVLALPTADQPRTARRHLALARVRALENGLVVVRSTTNGLRAVIDPFGRVVADSTAATQPDDVLVADVPVVREGTLLAGARRRFPITAALLLLILLAAPPTNRLPPIDADDEQPALADAA